MEVKYYYTYIPKIVRVANVVNGNGSFSPMNVLFSDVRSDQVSLWVKQSTYIKRFDLDHFTFCTMSFMTFALVNNPSEWSRTLKKNIQNKGGLNLHETLVIAKVLVLLCVKAECEVKVDQYSFFSMERDLNAMMFLTLVKK